MAHLCIHKVVIVSSAGCLVLLVGIILGWYGFPNMIEKSINQQISLFPGSEAMQRWLNLPIPLEFKVYFFNVTNPDEIHMGERPKLKEVGPYVFDLYKTKVNVSYNKFNDTLDYMGRNAYYFNAKKSHPNKENDKLVLLNVPLMGTATMVEKIFPMGLSFLNTAIPFLFPNITTMFLTATAKQFMFDGVLINCSYAVGPAMPVCNGMRGRLPATVAPVPDSKNFKFSFFRHKNESLEGPFKIYGGNKDVFKLGQIIEYRSNKHLTMWDPNTTCSQLKGTDSTVFPPIADFKENIYIYVPDVCLSLVASYVNKTKIKDITMYRYEGAETNFADQITVPENICRCAKNDVPKGPPVCLKYGAIDASTCQGAPVIFTQPHFLDADSEYTEYPEGMNPVRERHMTYVIVEPKTGAPIVGKKRMQMNMMFHKIEDIKLLANISEGLFPVAWVEEGGEINEEYLQKLADFYFILQSIEFVKWTIIVFSFILFLIAFGLYAKYRMLFCYNGNQVSEYGYGHGVNTFHINQKVGNDRLKSSTRPDTVPSISQKIPENKISSDLPS